MLDNTVEKNLHLRCSQLTDYLDTIVDVIEDAKVIPDFKKKVIGTYQQRLKQIYSLNGNTVMNIYDA